MVFKNRIAALEYSAKDFSRLLNDAGLRNGINDAALLVENGVLEREGEAGKRLSSAGWNRERVESRLFFRFLPALPQYVGTKQIDRRFLRSLLLLLHRCVELREQRCQLGIAPAHPALVCVHKGFRIQEVSVRQARKEHPYPKMDSLAVTARSDRSWRRRHSMKKCLWRFLYGFCEKASLRVFSQPVFECAIGGSVGSEPVRQPCMVPRNQISERQTQVRQFHLRMKSACAGVIHFARS
jgi:hypothetical protein